MTDNHAAELNAALAAAQGEFPPIPRDKKVTVRTRSGDSFEFAYAPLDTIIAACRPALAKHGLAIVQLLEQTETGPALRTELRHQAGGVVGSSFPLRPPETPQQLGSLLTYLRRYALTALLGIAAEEDDDAQAAADTGGKGPKTITDSQRRRLFAIAKDKAVSEDLLRNIIEGVTGDRSTSSIPVDRYDEIVALVEAEEVPF